MEFIRIQAGSCDGIDTHETIYFNKIWKSLNIGAGGVVDPFARNCSISESWSNDIDPSTTAKYHMDAIDFMKIVPSQSAWLVIFDPPFSPSQERKYEQSLKNVYATPGYVPEIMTDICRVLKTGGYMLKFGYNSTRHHPMLELQKGWICNAGGNRNDVIVTLWKKTMSTLNNF